MFRIAHVSDLHVLSATGAEWRRILFNKRITGYANLVLRRGRVHRREYLDAVLSAAAAHSDHVVVTGDITNLSLESEFDEARKLLDEVSRTVEVTVVPGNHDVYLHAIQRRFAEHFAPFLKSDLPELACDLHVGRYPCVKLRGPVAIIALSSAVPQPPFVAAGVLGRGQLEALAEVLAHPEVQKRTPVMLVHHPLIDRRMRLAQLRDGLVDADSLKGALTQLQRGLVLYGHTHVRVHCRLPTSSGALDVISASGAALDHPNEAVRAGFNRYEIAEDGSIASVGSHVLDPSGRSFVPMSIAEKESCL